MLYNYNNFILFNKYVGNIIVFKNVLVSYYANYSLKYCSQLLRFISLNDFALNLYSDYNCIQ